MSLTRQIFDVELRPITGSRFQPTGFPDLGAATFEKPMGENPDGTTRWVDALLVESAQSMANHLERTGWSSQGQAPVPELDGLPYVEVRQGADYVTSSRTEAHRLSSAFIRESTLDGQDMIDVLRDRLDLQDDRPLEPARIAAAVFALDPLSLIHGVFFSDKKLPGQPKIARALSAFIEATDVKPAHSGGVKKDDVRHSIAESSKGSTEGYGTIPYHRTEWVAGRITASFVLDLAQLESYRLGDDATALLADIGRWEVRHLLDGGLRLRTACDLEPVPGEISDRDGTALPTAVESSRKVRSGIAAVSDLLPQAEPWVVEWKGGKKS